MTRAVQVRQRPVLRPPPPEVPLTTPAPRPVVLVVTTAFSVGARVHRALGHAFDVVPVATVAGGFRVLEARVVAALLLEPEDAARARTAPLVAAARARRPALPVAAILRRSAGWSGAALALLDARPTTVLVAEDLDLRSVLRALASHVQEAALVDGVWPLLEDAVPPGLRALVRHVLAQASHAVTVPAAARALGLHRKTLWSRCRRHGVESVQVLVMWCRLIAAAHALRTRVGTVDAVAAELGFASPPALRNAIRRYLGVTATELRTEGGEGLACRAFGQWLRRAGARAAAMRAAEGNAVLARAAARPSAPHVMRRGEAREHGVTAGDAA
jgi:AraC-like DNA-binding protein